MAETESMTIWQEGNLSLREWQTSDVESSVRHLNDARVWNNLRNRIPFPYTEADAKWFINHCHDPESGMKVKSGKWTPENGSEGLLMPTSFAITVDGEAVGGIGLTFKDDVYFRTAEVGYWLGAEHWGKGIMGKVVPALIEWAWQTFDILLRINGETNESNVASQKLLQKAGFEYEGRRPDMVCKLGKIHAILLWGALRKR